MLRFLLLTLIVTVASVSFAHAAKLTIVNKPVSFGFTVSTTPRTIDTIIVHSTYNPALSKQTIGGAITMWQQYNVAPHYAIDMAGVVYRLVPEINIANHAGMATLPNGDTNINDNSIGIELIYKKTSAPNAKQYAALQSLIIDIKHRYTIAYILGHDQIAPGRKDDPWNFDNTKINHVFTPALKAFPLPHQLKNTVFQSSTAVLSAIQQTTMEQYSYRAGCPVPLADLRAVTVSYHDFNGSVRKGILIVNKSAVKNTITAFKGLFAQKFPIRQIAPIDMYQGIDVFSMAADNTSAFNCRYVDGTTVYSEHANGTAIDINPKENPAFTKATAGETLSVFPQVFNSKAKGAITTKIANSMKTAGFKWGGSWTDPKDYQHFSLNGK